jgi:hypothetical protein
MDDGQQVADAKMNLLHIFLIINNASCYEYQRALTCSLLLLHNYRLRNHKCWEMFCNNVSAFNEETGEICFSILARGLAAGGIRSDIKAVNKRYRLIRTKMDIAADLNYDLSGDDFNQHSRNTVHPNGPEVMATVAFFRDMIRKLRVNVYRHYDEQLGNMSDPRSARPRVPAARFTPLSLDVTSTYISVVDKLTKTMNSYWVLDHMDIWPQAMPSISDTENDSFVTSDSVGRSSDRDASPNPRTGRSGQENPSEHKQRRRNARRSRTRQHNAVNDQDNGVESQAPERVPRTLIGRIVKVPAVKLGVRWARRTYGPLSFRTAVVHAKITSIDENHRLANGPIECTFPTDNHQLRISQQEAIDMLVPVEEEGGAIDTQPLSSDSDKD